MKKVLVLLTLIATCMTACNSRQQKNTNMEKSNETQVLLETTLGNITVKLYNETPGTISSSWRKKAYTTVRCSTGLLKTS